MSARGKMRHRCAVERAVETNEGGDTVLTWQPHLSDVPCYAWFVARLEAAGETTQGDRTTVIEDRRVLMPAGTDITEADRIASITDRRGAVIHPGPMRIDVIGRRSDHLELLVAQVS